MENLTILKNLYESNGAEINWTTFNSDQESYKNRVVKLAQDDFADGTLRVHQPCMLKLTENISFNPNRPDMGNDGLIDPNRTLDWFPTTSKPSNNQYFENDVKFAYGLGFFAAIAIEAENVLVNLNNYILEQHNEHYLQQRFYAHIELADQPFIPFQGPSNFGHQLRSAKNCFIFNGKLGRSSHHCVHGNHVDGLYVHNVECDDFEVCAIAINGGKNITIDNTVIVKNKQDIPVLGTYSGGRFIKLFVQSIQNKGLSNVNLDNAYNLLKLKLDEAFNNFIFGEGNMPDLFKNTTGLIDGNAYGIVINPKGVAVNKFMESRNSNKANETTDIVIKNTSINGIHAHIREILAISNGLGKAQVDTAGAVLSFSDITNNIDDKYYYKGNVLANVQVELARIKNERNEQNLDTSFFGTLNITKHIVYWKDMQNSYFKKISDNELQLYINNVPVLDNGNDVIYKIFGNGDTMFHVNKGVLGLRIDGANSIELDNNVISDISNDGNKGSDIAGHYIKSHPDQGKMVGYHGSNTYGIVCSAVNNMIINNTCATNINSSHGSAFGIALQNDTCNCKLKNIKVNDINSSINNNFDANDYIFPNQPSISRGIFIGSGLTNIDINNINIYDINNSIGNPFNKNFDINSKITLS